MSRGHRFSVQSRFPEPQPHGTRSHEDVTLRCVHTVAVGPGVKPHPRGRGAGWPVTCPWVLALSSSSLQHEGLSFEGSFPESTECLLLLWEGDALSQSILVALRVG